MPYKEKDLDTLAIIWVVALKYEKPQFILLTGDFTLDLFNESYERDVRRVSLLMLTAELGLELIYDGKEPVMSACNGKRTSHIDFFLLRLQPN